MNKRTMLRSKIHRATVTDANVDYEGSCSISNELLKFADIAEFEQIEIYNVTNGERFTTYAIAEENNEIINQVCVNGAGAHKVEIGDLIIICTYETMLDMEAKQHVPTQLRVNEKNKIIWS